MLKLSRFADYAVVVLAEMARNGDDCLSAAALAESTGLSEPTVAKVLKQLAKGDLIVSERGAAGGYRLEKKAASLPVAEIIAAVDGPISLAACVEDSHESCALEGVCAMNGRWNAVNRAVVRALSAVTLADMMTEKRP